MAQTLEKIFLQKVAQMPPEEQEIVVPVAKNSHKKGASRAAGMVMPHGTERLLGGGSGANGGGGLLVLAQRSWRDSRLLSKCRLSPRCPTPRSTPQALTSPPP